MSKLYIPIAYSLRGVGQGDEMDSWHNIGHLNPETKRQLLDLILNRGLNHIPQDPGCPATAKSSVAVERCEDTDKKLL